MCGTFAAGTSFPSDRAATAASRVGHALARLMEEGQHTLQHRLHQTVSDGRDVKIGKSRF